MIDLHIHLLPGLDDGAQTWSEALRMASMAVHSGTFAIAATPHSNMPGFFETIWDARYRRRIQHLRELLEEQDIPLRVVEEMEIFATDDVLERLNSGQLICLNHTRYPLVEFAFEVDAMEIYRQMDRLLNAGYKPILAHPERYHCVMQDRSCIYDWYRMGIVIQINKGSILGRFGKHIQRTADAILRHRLAAVIASDAHGSLYRIPDLMELRRTLDWKDGEGCTPLLLERNPLRILQDKGVLWEAPSRLIGVKKARGRGREKERVWEY